MMKLRFHIQPRLLVLAVLAMAVLMFGTATIELRQSRDELYHVLSDHARSLASTIARSGANNLLATERMEELLTERLLDNARFIASLDSAGLLRSRAQLAAIAQANNLFRINVFDRSGRKLLSSHDVSPGHDTLSPKSSPVTALQPILHGDASQMVIGLKQARLEEGLRYAVAVRRTAPGGGAIVVNLDAQELVRFRRSLGIGRLLQEFGNHAGIIYLALQDSQGIIAASKGVVELSPVDGDSLVEYAVEADTAVTRISEYGGRDVFEVIQPFAPEGHRIGVLRIGLSMDEIRSTEARLVRRLAIISIAVVFLGSLAFFFLLSQQSFQAIEKEYTSIKSFTGNILTHMRDGVITVNADRIVTIFNASAEEMFHVRRTDVVGRTLDSLDLSGGVLSQLFSSRDGTGEFSIVSSGGRQRIVASSVSTSRSASGAVEGRTAVLRDLTEARHLEQEIRRKDKIRAMGELAAGVAHEIRNPLNAIAMIAQRFQKEFSPRKGVREYHTLTGVLQDETRRMNLIVRQFLTFARPPKLDRRPVPLADFLGHIAALFEGQASGKGVSFVLTIENNAIVSLDRDHMTQALLNVLQNALEATPRGGSITLKGSTDGAKTRIQVTDTGHGIPETAIDNVFNLYFTTRKDGTGLGLPIAQQIVAEHDGRLTIESHVGTGTIVTVEIP